MRIVGEFRVSGTDGAVTIHRPFESIHIPAPLVEDLLLAICGEHADPTVRILKLHAPSPDELAAYHAAQEPLAPDVLEDLL